ncbi:exosome complex protein Rrp42 [Candidatus Micrarchaeota archaeon]|nr:exosome complex protein Rrp42 [Candidatus Micrarchaeota archaeon]
MARESEILDEIKAEYVKDLLKQNKRVDDRGLMDYRAFSIEKGVFPNAEGSAMAHLGDTKVAAGIKFDIVKPYADRPTEGVFTVQAEYLPLAHPTFESGPPRENAIELARLVDRGIRSAECVDTASFFVEEEKVLGMFLDVYVLDHNGNLADCAALAGMSALANAKFPKIEDGAIVRQEFKGPLPLARHVVSATFEKINGVPILDAVSEEDTASDGRITLAISSDGFLCAAQKAKSAGFTSDELLSLFDVAKEKTKPLLDAVQK